MEKTNRERAEKWFAQTSGSGDIRSFDALKPNLQLYDAAINDQQNDRKSSGILEALGTGSNAGAANYKTYMNAKRQQDAAGQLENAYNATNADMTGQSYQLAQIANSRNLGKAGASSQAYNTYMQNKGPSMFDKFMQVGGLVVGGMGGVGAMRRPR